MGTFGDSPGAIYRCCAGWNGRGWYAAAWSRGLERRGRADATLGKVAGSFKIDHPLDPENK